MILTVLQHGPGGAHSTCGRRAASYCNDGGVDRPCCSIRPQRRKPHAGRCSSFIASLRSALRRRAVAQSVVFLLSSLLSAGTVLAQTSPGETTETAQVADAFADLDALSATIASRLQDLGRHSGLPPAPPPPGPAPPPPVPVPPADSGGPADAPPSPPSATGDVNDTEIHETEPKPCGTREDVDLRIGEVEERFGGFRQTINAANDDLPTYREGVRDANTRCTAQFESSIASTISRLDRLDIDAAYDVADELLACVDQRRRTIDGGLDQPNINDIQITILTDELDRLTDTTLRVRDKIQDQLLRAVSKRRRLVEELTQIRRVISGVCGT